MIRRMLSITIRGLVAVTFCFFATISTAQTVAIQNGLGERGFGWMFTHNGLCYAILPRHVAGPFPRVTITSEAPVVTGTGTVDLPFWDDIDLAIAVVRGGIEDRCVQTLDDLLAEQLNRVSGRLDLVRLEAAGERVRERLVVNSTSYLTFDAELENATSSIGQGTSGAFAMVNDNPVGMAVSAPTDNSALFIRADEIHMHLERYLSQYSGSVSPTLSAGTGTTALEQGFSLILSSSDLPPINPTLAPENVLSDGQYVFEFTSPNRLVFEIDSDEPVGVRRLLMQSDPESGYSIPREILFEFSPFETGGRFFEVMRSTMGQDGLMDTGVIGARTARRIRLTIISAWSDGPISISSIALQ